MHSRLCHGGNSCGHAPANRPIQLPIQRFVQGNSGVNPGFGLTYGFARFEREFNMALWLTSRPFRGVIVNRWAESRPDVSRRI